MKWCRNQAYEKCRAALTIERRYGRLPYVTAARWAERYGLRIADVEEIVVGLNLLVMVE